ncbi:MAG TPA: ABC transporter ATP-binding protein [Flavisolibacter sp.]|jgi:iron(III) transport system ATP-binding protein|nr:ABC transporter ATP-binding protein [Flavisolibacter sp.]
MNLLQVSHLFKYNRDSVVLNDIDVGFSSFQRLAVSGETGSGKTTLLKAIAGLVQPDKGTVFFQGEKVLGPEERLLPGHPGIAYLSQHFELRNNYRLEDFLEMASSVGEKEARRIYELCQVDHLLKRKTDQLSGGERQRTALARLLTTSPRLLLLDEPYSNLDSIHKQTLKEVINAIVAEGKTSCIMVSHDPLDVLPWAEAILILQDGKLIQQGTPEQVYRHPATEYVGGLLGEYNLFPAEEVLPAMAGENPAPGKQLFVRPERISLQKDATGKGRIQEIKFYGSYVLIEVAFGEKRIIAKSIQAGFEKGEAVSITVSPDDLWFVS